jgi:hypothetical protein
LWTVYDKSDTVDEPTYMAAAALQWRYHDFYYNLTAPVVPKWGFALAMRAAGNDFRAVPDEIGAAQAALLWRAPPALAKQNLHAARAATLLATLLGGLCILLAASRFGRTTGLLALALWCFSPTVLAQGGQATLDAWAGSAAALVLLATVRAIEQPTWGPVALCGAACGVAAGCKLTALTLVPFAAIAVVLALRSRSRSAGQPWRSRAALALGPFAGSFVLALWAPYGFTGGPGTFGATAVAWVPLHWWLGGAEFTLRHGFVTGHTNYLFGELRNARGFPLLYVASFALRTTLGVQLLVMLRVLALAKRRAANRELWQDAVLLAFPLALAIGLSLGRAQLGMRYLLPAFPCAILWASRALGDARRLFRHGELVCAAAMALCIADTVRTAPHFIMYFNAWAGGPDHGSRYLASEQGQDKRRLAEWIARNHPTEPITYLRFGSVDGMWGLPPDRPPPCQPTPGIYAIHLFRLHRGNGCLNWLTVEAPDEILGHSILLWRVDGPRSSRLARERGQVTPFFQVARRGGRPT